MEEGSPGGARHWPRLELDPDAWPAWWRQRRLCCLPGFLVTREKKQLCSDECCIPTWKFMGRPWGPQTVSMGREPDLDGRDPGPQGPASREPAPASLRSAAKTQGRGPHLASSCGLVPGPSQLWQGIPWTRPIWTCRLLGVGTSSWEA